MFRIVNNYDVVPHLPHYATGFRHVGEELWFSSKLKTAQRKALLIKNKHAELPDTDPVELSGLMDACANTVPFNKLGIIDHVLYHDRITGQHRLRGAKLPQNPVKSDGRIEIVSDNFMEMVYTAGANTLLWEYQIKSLKKAKNKEPFRQLMQYAKDLEKEGIYWNLQVVQINTLLNDVPPTFAPANNRDTTVYFVGPMTTYPAPRAVRLEGKITFESLKALVEAHWQPCDKDAVFSCATTMSMQEIEKLKF